MGPSFEPKLPHLLSAISNDTKLRVVHLLTSESEIIVGTFFDKMQADWLLPFQCVSSYHEVNDYDKILLKSSRKTDASILAKAVRPAILQKHPRFSVEHVR